MDKPAVKSVRSMARNASEEEMDAAKTAVEAVWPVRVDLREIKGVVPFGMPSIYSPLSAQEGQPPMYMATVPVANMPGDLLALLPQVEAENATHLRASTRRRPWVSVWPDNKVDRLVMAVSRATAMNMSADTIFEGRIVTVMLRVTPWESGPMKRRGVMLSFDGVRIELDGMEDRIGGLFAPQER